MQKWNNYKWGQKNKNKTTLLFGPCVFASTKKTKQNSINISGEAPAEAEWGGDVKTANDEDAQSMRFVSNVVELLFGHVSQSIATS